MSARMLALETSELLDEVVQLRTRLDEAEETLRAIRSGEVDALVVAGPEGERVFTLQGADRPYRVLIEHMQEGALTMTSEGDVLYCNRFMADLIRRRIEAVIGQRFGEVVAPDDQDVFKSLLAQATQDTTHGELRLVRPDGDLVSVRVSLNGVPLDGVEAVVMVVTDLTDQKRRQDEDRLLQTLAVAVSQADDVDEALRLVVTYVVDVTGWCTGEAWLLDDGRMLRSRVGHATDSLAAEFVAAGAALPMPYGRGLAGKAWRRGHPCVVENMTTDPDLVRRRQAERAGLVTGFGIPVFVRGELVCVVTFTSRVRTPNDERWVRVVSAAVAQLGAVIQRRRTEERVIASLREKEILLKEVHHRVKNNLQVITSLLRMQSRTVTDPSVRKLLAESEDRIRSMALVHESLYASDDLSKVDFRRYLGRVVDQLAQSYAADGIRTELQVGDVSLDVDTAIPLGLVVTELASNAFKHAFPGERGGTLTIALDVEGDALHLFVRDDGVGSPEADGRSGRGAMGLRIVRTLVEQLDGELVQLDGPGTGFHVSFPWPRKITGGAK